MTRRFLVNLMAGAAVAQDAVKPAPPRPPRPIDAPVDVTVPLPPTPFRANGKTHLVYELHITNFGRVECLLTRVEAVFQSQTFVTYDGDFANVVSRPGVQTKEPLRVDGGLRAIVFVWATLDSAIPTMVEHRIGLKIGDDEFSTLCAKIAVRKEAISIKPPLRGDGWMAANGPANLSSGHRRSLIPIGGGARVPERFAIDWLQLDKNGQSYTGDRLDNKNYRCYGNELFAVADGTVVAVKDGIPENIPGANSRAVPITLETVGGNHIMLDIGGGHYAFCAHAQPGKIRVKLGDRVKEGQVLGLLGNSGNSTEPHLHFHICDANSPLGSEGLPYQFSSFEFQGMGGIVRDQATNTARFGWTPSNAAERRSNEMPLQNMVVRLS